MTKYNIDIGLEVHVELSTRSKMFCSCAVVDNTISLPNSSTCPVCCGMPGTLPVINLNAVDLVLRDTIALECEIKQTRISARKNYFYPDLPKGYQISQYEHPLAENGKLLIRTDEGNVDGITGMGGPMDVADLTYLVDYLFSGGPDPAVCP